MTTATTAPQPQTIKLFPILAAAVATMLLAALDQMIFSTAQATIVGELRGVNHQMWIAAAYMLASTVMMPVYGKFSDILGRKPLYLCALGAFLLGSIIGGLSESMTQLIVGRAIQGFGGGGLMILSQAIIADVVPPRQRGKYMGLMGAVFGLSSVLGPLLGGWFTEGPGWRWAFWINLPLGGFAIAATILFLTLPVKPPTTFHADMWGIFTMAGAVSCLILATSLGGQPEHPWNSPLIFLLFTGMVLFSAVFVFIELRVEDPLIPMRIFAVRNVRIAITGGLIVGIAMFGSLTYLPTYLQMVTGLSTTQSGLLMIPLTIGIGGASTLSGFFTTRTGRYKILPVLGTPIICVGLVLFSTMTVTTSHFLVAVYQFILGLGIGMCMQTLVLVVQNSLSAHEVGTATSSYNFFRQIGMSLGASLFGSIFVNRLRGQLDVRLHSLPPQELVALEGGVGQLEPDKVNALAVSHPLVHDAVIHAFNSALTPIFSYLIPLVLFAFVVLLLLREAPLKTSLDSPEDALAAGLPLTAAEDAFLGHTLDKKVSPRK